jgi:hypothetical protein
VIVRLEYAHGLAGLHQQSFVVGQSFQGRDYGVVGFPTARGAAGSAVDDEILWALGNLGVEVVHEHAHGGFLLPAFAGDGVSAGGANGSWGLSFGFDGHE